MIAVACAGIVAFVAPAAAKEPEAAVASRLDSAMNSGNLDAAMGLFGDDATARDILGQLYAGRTQIREWLSGLVAQGYHADSGNRQVSSERVTWTASISYESLRRLKVAPLDAFGDAAVRDGKIRSFTMRLSAAAAMKLQSAQLASNREIARRALEDIFNSGNGEAVDRNLDAGFVDHNPFPGQTPDLGGFKAAVVALRGAFPNLKVTIEDLLAEGDKVIARLTVRGTHAGPFMGRAATGKSFSAMEMRLFRVKDGKLAEHWGTNAQEAIIEQLGLAPAATWQAAAPAAAVGSTSRAQPAYDAEKMMEAALARLLAAASRSAPGKTPAPPPEKKRTTAWY